MREKVRSWDTTHQLILYLRVKESQRKGGGESKKKNSLESWTQNEGEKREKKDSSWDAKTQYWEEKREKSSQKAPVEKSSNETKMNEKLS